MSARWAAVLDDFEGRLERFEAALRRGDVAALPARWEPPADLDERPTARQRERAEALLARCHACEQRLGALMHAVAGELHGLRARSEAASSYHDHARPAAATGAPRSPAGAPRSPTRRV